jgi:hypothetical protein
MPKTVTIPSTTFALQEYHSFHDADYFVANADIGNYAQISTKTFNGSRISMLRIGQVLGSASRSLATLSQSGNINPHALFIPSGVTPHAMSEFVGYNHGALPNTYWLDPKTESVTVEYGTQLLRSWDFQYGEKTPQDTAGNYHQRFDVLGNILLGLGVTVDGVDPSDLTPSSTDIKEYAEADFPLTVVDSFAALSELPETIDIEPHYYTRNTIFVDWVKENLIEDGAGSITIATFNYTFNLTNLTFAPTTVTIPIGKTFENVTFAGNVQLTNTSPDNFNGRIYWGIYKSDGGFVRLAGDSSIEVVNTGSSITYTIPSTNLDIYDFPHALIF